MVPTKGVGVEQEKFPLDTRLLLVYLGRRPIDLKMQRVWVGKMDDGVGFMDLVAIPPVSHRKCMRQLKIFTNGYGRSEQTSGRTF